MTKKDYELIAYCFNTVNTYSVIADALEAESLNLGYSFYNSLDKIVRRKMAYKLAYHLNVDNPRFDLDRFMRACGLGDEA
jgi:hypothetical protein